MVQGIVFPGQGSQTVGMLADIATHYAEIEQTFAIASKVLGYDLWQLTQQGPAEELDKTIHAQPALLTASYALWRVISGCYSSQSLIFAGHSLGEYTALVCAGAIEFPEAVKLVAARGQFMQEAVPMGQGALAAIIGLDEAAVLALCQEAALNNEVLAPANFNSPGQIVIGGDAAAVDRALVLAKAKGAKIAKRLTVSVPSHCSLMKPAAEKLAGVLATLNIQTPVVPVINNVDVKQYHSADSVRDGLIRQLYMPVRWVEVIQSFVTQGVQQVVECGPGKVLTGLNKRITDQIQFYPTSDWVNLQQLLS